MHTINLVEKAYIMEVDYETTLGATILEKIVIRNGKKHSHNMVFYNYLGSPTQSGDNSRRSQYLHVFVILFSCFNRGKKYVETRNKNAFAKPWLKYSADSSAYSNFVDMHILLLKGNNQPLADALFFRCFLK